MLNAYKRTARSFQELNAGPLAPLDQALPELRAVVLSGGVGHYIKKQREKLASPRGFEALLTPGSPHEIAGYFDDLQLAMKLIA